MVEETSVHGWQYPTVNDDEDVWGELLNTLIESDLDEAAPLRLSDANRPASPPSGVWNIDFDAATVSYYDGAAWQYFAGRDLDGDDLVDAGVVIWDSANGYVPSAQVQGLDAHTGDTTNPHSVTAAQAGAIADADYDPVEVRSGALVDRPAAGTANRWYFTTDNNGIHYDDGASWLLIAEYPGNIGAADLGFDPATQAELDSHTGDTTNPHSVTASQAGAPTQTEFDNHTGDGTIHVSRSQQAIENPQAFPVTRLSASEEAAVGEVVVQVGEQFRLHRAGAHVAGSSTNGTLDIYLDGTWVEGVANSDAKSTTGIYTFTNSGTAESFIQFRLVNSTGADQLSPGMASHAGYVIEDTT